MALAACEKFRDTFSRLMGTSARTEETADLVNDLQGGLKMEQFLCALTSSNINRFSKFFHRQNQEKTCNNTITKDPTTPQVCRYTTL